MNIKLVQPPIWIPTQPYLSIPSLVSYLNKNDIKSEQLDINLVTFDYLFSEVFMKSCFLNLRHFKYENKTNSHNEVIKYIEIEDFIMQNLNEYRQGFKEEKCTNYYEYVSHRFFLETCINIINATYENETLKFDDYKINYNIFNSNDLQTLFMDYEKGLLDDYLIYKVIENGTKYINVDDNNTLIGISITGTSQIIPSLLMAKALKNKNKNIKIVIGGNVPSRWIESFNKIKYIFNFIDYIILNEGEEPLVQLINFLKNKISINEVYSLVYLNDESKVIVNEKAKKLIFNDLETPIFDTKTIGEYYSPVITLPLLSSRGCYWGKCSFCDHSHVYQKNYTVRSLEYLVADINEYQEIYKAKNINFHDEAISPKRLHDFSNNLLEKDINLNWTCDAKIENNLDLNILKQGKYSGLKVLYFGLESGNQRVLDSMNKGIKVEYLNRILKDSTDIGIWNHLFYFKGFPGETEEEFKDTMDFIKDNNDIIQTTGGGSFSLNRFSNVALSPDKYNVIIEEDNNDIDFSFNFEVSNSDKTNLLNETNLNDPNLMGSYYLFSNNIFRDHWVIFADTIREYIENGYEYDDKYFYPWVYLGNHEMIINLNKGLILKVEPFVIDMFNMLNEYKNTSEILFHISRELNLSLNDSEEVYYNLLDFFYENKLMPKARL